MAHWKYFLVGASFSRFSCSIFYNPNFFSNKYMRITSTRHSKSHWTSLYVIFFPAGDVIWSWWNVLQGSRLTYTPTINTITTVSRRECKYFLLSVRLYPIIQDLPNTYEHHIRRILTLNKKIYISTLPEKDHISISLNPYYNCSLKKKKRSVL